LLHITEADRSDLPAIRAIYNEGIADRLATLESDPKDDTEMAEWFASHAERYVILVAKRADEVVGWASLNPYSHRCAYAGVADLSVYVARAARGSGVGAALLAEIDGYARRHNFHKVVLFALTVNEAGLRLYRKAGYREVGLFREQGILDGRFVDVIAMEKLMRPLAPFVP
jgi:L-amino acid N-acyltransferase YncA